MHLQKSKCYATKIFAKTLLHFGTNAVEQLKKNACMLSAMGDSPFNNAASHTNFTDEKTVDGIDRGVALLVKKNPNNKQGGLVKFVMLNKKETIPLTKETYERVVETAENWNRKFFDGKAMHKHNTAIQYLRAWGSFIQWSCDFASESMTLNQVNSLVSETEKVLLPIPIEVKGQMQTNDTLGMRHFITTSTKYNGKDTLQRLNQLLMEHRHLETTKVKAVDKQPKCVVVGIPGGIKKTIKAIAKSRVTLPGNDKADEAKTEAKNNVHEKANLKREMVQRLWEIARESNGRSMGQLMTYTYKRGRDTKRDSTIPLLVDNNDDAIHEHYVGNYNCPNFFLQKHLHKALNEQQLKAFIIDHSWDNDSESGEYEPSENVTAQNKTAMFDEIIPMLARMSFLSDDGAILLPHHPWVVANVYNNEKTYRPLFDIDFIKGDDEKTVIDVAHDKWKKIHAGFKELGYNLDQSVTRKNEVLYNAIIGYGKKYQAAATLYAQQWDFVEPKAMEETRWVRLRPKKLELSTKLNQDIGKKDDKMCISLGTIESRYKEEVEKVKQGLEADDANHKKSTLILGLQRDRQAPENDKSSFCFDDESEKIQNFDQTVRCMLNEFLDVQNMSRSNEASWKLSTLLRWSIFRSLHKTNDTVEAFSFEQSMNIEQDKIHQNLEHKDNVVVRNRLGDWNRHSIVLGMTKLGGAHVKYDNVIVDHVGKTDFFNNMTDTGQYIVRLSNSRFQKTAKLLVR